MPRVGDDRTGRPGPTDPATDQGPGRRLTVPEAAAALGISADAVRSRIKRETLASVREGGRVFVVLGGPARAQPTNRPGATDQPTDQGGRTAELIATLREQLQAERDANRENRRIIVALTSRIPQLEAPRETPEAAETPAPEPEGASPRSDSPGPQTAPQRRPWWRRVFGG